MFAGQATRRTQPHRRGSDVRVPGPALSAMLAGQPASLPNPMDQQRRVQRDGRRAFASLSELIEQAATRMGPLA